MGLIARMQRSKILDSLHVSKLPVQLSSRLTSLQLTCTCKTFRLGLVGYHDTLIVSVLPSEYCYSKHHLRNHPLPL